MSDAQPKMILRERLKAADEQRTKLSYSDLFVQKKVENVDVQQALEVNNFEWNRKLAEARKAAVQEGYKTGFQDGKAEAQAQIDQHLGDFEHALLNLEREIFDIVERIKPGITSLIFDMAEKVVGVRMQNEAIQQQVEQQVNAALATVTEGSTIKITVASEQFETIQKLGDRIKDRSKITIWHDDNLAPGEFNIETGKEAIINNFKKKLGELRDTVQLDDWGKDESGTS